MKLVVITLLISFAATSILAVGGRFYRSPTPGAMWVFFGRLLFVLNFPGLTAAILVESLTGRPAQLSNDFLSLVLCALGNWLGYFGVAKLALFLKHKISSDA